MDILGEDTHLRYEINDLYLSKEKIKFHYCTKQIWKNEKMKKKEKNDMPEYNVNHKFLYSN